MVMTQTLKVLNAVREFEIGIPITYEQYVFSILQPGNEVKSRYIAISPSSLVQHLLTRNLHLLALRISQFLALRPDPVLVHWATAKISRSRGIEAADDEEICAAIVNKFEKEGEKSVSYASIAKKAWEAGRTKLATMVGHSLEPTGNANCQLLDHEMRAAEQVPLLLQMKEDKIALVKAIDSGDTDLGWYCG